MGNLDMISPRVKLNQLPQNFDAALAHYEGRERRLRSRNIETLIEFARCAEESKPKSVHFDFFASPVEILGGNWVEAIRFERTVVEGGKAINTGEIFDIDCGLIIPSIGYRSEPIEGAPFDEKRESIPNDNGRIDLGLYAVGWIKRGPNGVISSNRPDGEIVAGYILKDIIPDHKKLGRHDLEVMLKDRNLRWIGYSDWKKLEAMEIAAASGLAPREKFVTIEDMIAALDEVPVNKRIAE
jgi:ferredoxin--NADP+ reductase